jgi:hypothetical protein
LTAKPSKSKANRAVAHADLKPANLRMVNGRLVGPTLADPGMEAAVKRAQKKLFPTREAAIEHFRKQGVLTRSGKLTKAYGG